MAREGSSPGGAPPPPPDCVVALCTVPDEATAGRLAEALVSEGLVACVNIVPGLTSVYMWKGTLNKDPELLLVMKTTAPVVPSLTARVKELHPYNEPELISLPITGGSASYLAWVAASTSGSAAAAAAAAAAAVEVAGAEAPAA